jgi:hypothetical protein
LTTSSVVPSTGPVFDPNSALGWRDIALDGLSCYLRCVEAVLAAHGYKPSQVTEALAGPLRLIEDGGDGWPRGDYRGCEVAWQQVPPGQSLWEELAAVLAGGGFAVLSPDSYWWPGDELAGKVHGHHHMVLPVSLHDGRLHYLDTDAPAEGGFRASQADGAALRQAVNTIGVISLSQRPRPLRESWRAVLIESASRLEADLAELRALACRWLDSPPSPMLARALHVLVLGEVQPPLFLFASALGGEPRLDSVTRQAFRAAARAKKLGIMLTGLHRFDSAALYGICLDELEALCRALADLGGAMAEAAGTGMAPAPAPAGRLSRRLAGLLRWSFDQDGRAAIDWLGSG